MDLNSNGDSSITKSLESDIKSKEESIDDENNNGGIGDEENFKEALDDVALDLTCIPLAKKKNNIMNTDDCDNESYDI